MTAGTGIDAVIHMKIAASRSDKKMIAASVVVHKMMSRMIVATNVGSDDVMIAVMLKAMARKSVGKNVVKRSGMIRNEKSDENDVVTWPMTRCVMIDLTMVVMMGNMTNALTTVTMRENRERHLRQL
jgi:hypothetical protein